MQRWRKGHPVAVPSCCVVRFARCRSLPVPHMIPPQCLNPIEYPPYCCCMYVHDVRKAPMTHSRLFVEEADVERATFTATVHTRRRRTILRHSRFGVWGAFSVVTLLLYYYCCCCRVWVDIVMLTRTAVGRGRFGSFQSACLDTSSIDSVLGKSSSSSTRD